MDSRRVLPSAGDVGAVEKSVRPRVNTMVGTDRLSRAHDSDPTLSMSQPLPGELILGHVPFDGLDQLIVNLPRLKHYTVRLWTRLA